MSPAEEAIQELQQWGITSWSLLLVCVVPLLLLMKFRSVYPTVRFARLAGILFLLSLPIIAWPQTFWLVPAFFALGVILFASVDLLTLPRVQQIGVSRRMSRVASLGNEHPVELQLDNRGMTNLNIILADDAVDGLSVEPPSHEVALASQKRSILQHVIVPGRRGAFRLEYLYGRVRSRLGLWSQQHLFPCSDVLHVYPDIKQIGKYALLARTNRLSQIGVRRTRKIGQDNEFERLRDYTTDDNFKHIDWRSTARRGKLTVKQFQANQSQRVIFLLDCGRMMTNEYEGLSLLDYALNAVLMLGYVALDQGDSVGMLCFSDEIHTYVPPKGGRKQMNRLLHAGFDQFPRLVQSRFDQAFLHLSQNCRKRSLVVLVTNVIDRVNAEQVQSYMKNLGKGHLPLVVLLRDHRMFEFADNPAPDPEVMYRSAAASQLLLWRNQVITEMRSDGALALDVFPDAMTSPLVNSYLEVKARHLL
ncbi:MAG: DUF58 domain-containing protein [Pirellulaceae bacterium]